LLRFAVKVAFAVNGCDLIAGGLRVHSMTRLVLWITVLVHRSLAQYWYEMARLPA